MRLTQIAAAESPDLYKRYNGVCPEGYISDGDGGCTKERPLEKKRRERENRCRPSRLSDFVEAEALVSVPFLKKLAQLAAEQSTKDALQRVIRNLENEYSGVEPFPVDELWGLLRAYHADEDDLDTLMKVKTPRTRTKKPSVDAAEARRRIEEATGKSIVDGVRWEAADHTAAVRSIVAAFMSLRKVKPAYKVFVKQVKKIKLTDRGSADASWLPGGVLQLRIKATQRYRVPLLRGTLVHEMGHAFEEYFDAVELSRAYWDPPHLNDLAEKNSSESFAETFRALALEPALLRRKTPEKYADMLRRVKEKL